jgi:hypothetical protein
MRRLSRPQFFAVLAEIDVDAAALMEAAHTASSAEEAQAAVEAFKVTARKAFKRRLFEVHPDRSELPDAEERMKELNIVRPAFEATLDTLHLRPIRPQREVIYHTTHRARGFQHMPVHFVIDEAGNIHSGARPVSTSSTTTSTAPDLSSVWDALRRPSIWRVVK